MVFKQVNQMLKSEYTLFCEVVTHCSMKAVTHNLQNVFNKKLYICSNAMSSSMTKY